MPLAKPISNSKILQPVLLFILIFSLCLKAYAVIPKPPERPLNYVTDLARVINPQTSERINELLRDLERKTTAQIFILTIKSLEGQSIESFSIAMAEKWKPGVKGKDNGILITIAIDDRRYRIEVGYGLEEIIPDSLAGSLARQVLVSKFREGQYGDGLYNLAKELAKIITTHQETGALPYQQQRQDTPKPTEGLKEIGWLEIILLIPVGLFLLYLLFKHPELLLYILLSSSRGGRWSSGGGFGGGRGGGFGGGGVSGRW